MVAVARDGVELAELVLLGFEHVGDGLEETGDRSGRRLGGGRALGRDGHGRRLGVQRGLVALDVADRALAVGRGVAGGVPVGEELVVHPHERQGDPRHVQARDELAGFDVDAFDPRGLQSVDDAADHDEELLVLRGPQAVDDRDHATARIGGTVLEQALDEGPGDLVGGAQAGFVDSRLAVDAQADAHLAFGHGEERAVGAGERATGEGYAEGPRGGVGLGEDALDLLEVLARLGGGARDLEDGEVPRDPAALVEFVLGPRGDVVGDHQGVRLDPLRAQALDGLPEVQDVAGVVAEAHEDPRAALGRLHHGVGLRPGGGGEDVAAHGSVGDAHADPAREGRIVAGPAAVDHGDLAVRRGGGAHDASVDGFDVPFVG